MSNVAIFYTGAGRLASELAQKLAPPHVVAYWRVSESGWSLQRFLSALGPLEDRIGPADYVINMMGFGTSVVMTDLTTVGTLFVAAQIKRIPVVHISTDEVYVSDRPAPAVMQPKPDNFGLSAWLIEWAALNIARPVIVRTSRLFGFWPEREIESIAGGRLTEASSERTTYTCALCFVSGLATWIPWLMDSPDWLPQTVHIVSAGGPISAAELTRVRAKTGKMFEKLSAGLIKSVGPMVPTLPPVTSCYEQWKTGTHVGQKTGPWPVPNMQTPVN